MYSKVDFIAAAKNNDNELFKKIFMTPGINIKQDCSEALLISCERGHTELVKMMLDDGRASPTINDGYPLAKACQYDHPEIVKLLLADSRVSPNTCNEEPIKNACMFGNLEVVKILLEDGRVNPFLQDNTAINSMIININIVDINFDIVRMILESRKETLNNLEYIKLAIIKNLFDLFKFILEIERHYIKKIINNIVNLCIIYKHINFIKWLMINKYFTINDLESKNLINFKKLKIIPDYTPRRKSIIS